MKPIIVVSASRAFIKSGTLKLTEECLKYLDKNLSSQYQIKALVYQKELYPELPGIEYISFPAIRKGVIKRLYYEYVYFYKLSKKWNPCLWLSMQDTTPTVQAKVRAVYFHNAHAGEPLHWKFLFKDFKHFLLHFLYLYVYPININKNNRIIIQQDSLARKIIKRFNIPFSKIIKFPVNIQPVPTIHSGIKNQSSTFVFIYPATTFPYKNFDIIVKAVKVLNDKGIDNFEVIFTTDGKENHYARGLKKQSDSNIIFKPFMPADELYNLYRIADCLLFPSLVESWGLPLSEFMQTDKPILVADLPYAHETTSGYEKVKFFDPKNVEQLTEYMLQAMKGELMFDKNIVASSDKYETVHSWKQLFDKILATNP